MNLLCVHLFELINMSKRLKARETVKLWLTTNRWTALVRKPDFKKIKYLGCEGLFDKTKLHL